MNEDLTETFHVELAALAQRYKINNFMFSGDCPDGIVHAINGTPTDISKMVNSIVDWISERIVEEKDKGVVLMPQSDMVH